ncbi:MAG: helix-turn-helix domain-containing protein [Eubacteriales bacterium]
MESVTHEVNMTFFNNIQRLCHEKGISVTALGQELGLSNATTAGWRKGSQPRGKTLKTLADYFDVTVDQLMSEPTITVNDNHGIIGHTHAPVTIINGSERKLSEQEVELLNIFGQLSVIEQAKLIVYAEGLKEKK